MKHASTRALFDYWNEQRGLRRAPDRADIDPGAIRHILADTFILAYDLRAGHPFRLAGTRVCAAFGRELRGEPFVGLWDEPSNALARDLLTVLGKEAVGMVASTSANSAAGRLDLELVMLPLSHRGRTNLRVIGALAPTETPYWLGISTLGPLSLGTLRYLSAECMTAAPAIPALPTSRHRHGLLVYEGGRP
jgi:hypothetical protein